MVGGFIDNFTLIALIAPIFCGFIVGWVSESVQMGGVTGILILGYIAVQSQNGALMGAFLISLLFSGMGTAVFMAKTILGDTR